MKQQIKENTMQKLLEAEQIEKEGRRMKDAQIAMQREDLEKVKQKHEKRLKVQEELRKINDNLTRCKLIQQEEEKIADMRVSFSVFSDYVVVI